MKKLLIYSTLIFTIGMIVFFKSFIVYALESSLTTLLETPVKVKELRLFSLELYASIKNNNNNAYIKINSLYPLKADVTYEGNADAFKVYQPLKAEAKLKGSVYYKDALVVKAEFLALGAKSVVAVKEFSEDWEVVAHIKDLNLSQLQYENNISTKMLGVLDADVNYHTSKDSVITVSSKKLKITGKTFEDVKVQLNKVEQNIYTWAIFKSDELDYKGIWFNYDEEKKSFDGSAEFAYFKIEHDIKLKVKGDFNNTQLKADIQLESADSILCYVCSNETMVVDNYTQKLLLKLGFEFEDYDDIQQWLISGIQDYGDMPDNILNYHHWYAIFHGFIVEYCKQNKCKNIELGKSI